MTPKPCSRNRGPGACLHSRSILRKETAHSRVGRLKQTQCTANHKLEYPSISPNLCQRPRQTSCSPQAKETRVPGDGPYLHPHEILPLPGAKAGQRPCPRLSRPLAFTPGSLLAHPVDEVSHLSCANQPVMFSARKEQRGLPCSEGLGTRPESRVLPTAMLPFAIQVYGCNGEKQHHWIYQLTPHNTQSSHGPWGGRGSWAQLCTN